MDLSLRKLVAEWDGNLRRSRGRWSTPSVAGTAAEFFRPHGAALSAARILRSVTASTLMTVRAGEAASAVWFGTIPSAGARSLLRQNAGHWRRTLPTLASGFIPRRCVGSAAHASFEHPWRASGRGVATGVQPSSRCPRGLRPHAERCPFRCPSIGRFTGRRRVFPSRRLDRGLATSVRVSRTARAVLTTAICCLCGGGRYFPLSVSRDDGGSADAATSDAESRWIGEGGTPSSPCKRPEPQCRADHNVPLV